MISYRVGTTIRASAEMIFPYLVQAELHPHWMNVISASQMPEGPTRVGSQFLYALKIGPRTLRRVATEVVEIIPDRAIRFRTAGRGPLDWEATFMLQPIGEASAIVSTGTIRLQGFWSPFERLMRGEIRSREAKELDQLKALVEHEQHAVS